MPLLPNIKKSFTKAKTSVRKRGLGGAYRSIRTASQLSTARRIEKRTGLKWPNWNTSLSEAEEKFFGMNVREQIRRHSAQEAKQSPNYTVLNLGCGSGRLTNDLAQTISDNARIIATGVAHIKEWSKQSASKKIDWHIAHAENLSSRIEVGSVNFLLSNFGLAKSTNLKVALNECANVLAHRGRILLTVDGLKQKLETQKVLKESGKFKLLQVKHCPQAITGYVFYAERI
jgi:ubiquinone/menaquinone biosynthesis C-methylase UbiE